MKILVRFCALAGAFTLGLQLPAQAGPRTPTPAVEAAAKATSDALQFRAGLVADIVGRTEQSAEALTRLKARPSSTGLNLDRDVDFAFGAIDVGQRLVAAGKPAAAEKFFQEAETSLDAVVKRTPDSSARDKAQSLRKLSFLRSHYLNKIAQAKTDIERAIALQPEDKELQRAKDALAQGNAEHFKDKSKR